MKQIIMLTLITLSVGISASSAQIITNGSFENSPCPISGYILFPDEPGVAAWDILGGPIRVLCDGAASNGEKSIDLYNGAVTQVIPTSAGVLYRVTFDLGSEPSPHPEVKTLRITADNASAADYEHTYNPLIYAMNWEGNSYEFLAIGSTTRLAFTSTTIGYYGPAIDNLVATAIGGLVCHRNNGAPSARTLNLNAGSFAAHINHGDQHGGCP